MADGDNVACPAYIQVRSREGDEARVSHSMLVPTQQITRAEAYFIKLTFFFRAKEVNEIP